MRKLKLQVQITADGFIAGPNGEMDWMTFNWSADIMQYVTQLTEPVGTIVLGRNLAQGFIPHWAAVAADPGNPEAEAGKKFTETPKVVFSGKLQSSEWENTALAAGSLEEEIGQLKNRGGGDIIAYGGAQFVSSLIKANLIDEYHLFVNPVAIGKGLPIFAGLEEYLRLELAHSQAFACGIVVQVYRPAAK